MNSYEELAVLGAILLSPESFYEIDGYLKENDFYSEQHRLIFRAIVALSIEGNPIDLVSVCAKLKENKCLTRAGGTAYVSSLVDACPNPANVKFYADQIIEQATARDLRLIGKQLAIVETKPRDALEKAMKDIIELSERAVVSNEESIGDISSKLVQDIISGNEESAGINTGFADIDKYMMGMGSGDLILVGARPSVGKSSFALQVATNVAKDGKHVLFISPEMTKAQLSRRLLSVEANVSYRKLLKGKSLTDDERERIIEAHKKIITLPLTVDDGSNQTLTDLRLKARRMKARGGIDLIVVDYLQLLCSGDDNKEEVTLVSKGLKALAKDLSIPVFAVSQLSRAPSYRESSRPVLTDLRSSGQLDQDADVVVMLWHTNKERDKVEIFLEKHRNGPLGGHIYHFDKDTTEFRGGGW